MKVKELIEKLQQIDPETDVHRMDNEYGPEPIETLSEVHTYLGSQKGEKIWCVE